MPKLGRHHRLNALAPFALVATGIALVTAIALGWAVPDLLWGRWVSSDQWRRSPARSEVALNASRGSLLPVESAIAVAHQCSRAAPPIVRRAWAPSQPSLQQLASDLAPLLQAIDDTLPRHPDEHVMLLRDYYRQYAGLELESGERVIYVSAFHPDELRLVAQFGGDTTKWRQSPMNICDGGRGFWGIEYDPVSRRFRGFAFNGTA